MSAVCGAGAAQAGTPQMCAGNRQAATDGQRQAERVGIPQEATRDQERQGRNKRHHNAQRTVPTEPPQSACQRDDHGAAHNPGFGGFVRQEAQSDHWQDPNQQGCCQAMHGARQADTGTQAVKARRYR